MPETQAAELIRVMIAPDHLEAQVDLTLLPSGEVLPEESLLGLLEDAGVRYGILQDEVGAIGRGEATSHKVVIARGTRAVAGAAGWAEVLVPTISEKDLIAQSNGHLTCRVANVTKGTPLVRLHPPTAGTPGTGVNGAPLVAVPGRPMNYRPGAHTAWTDDRHEVVASTEDGNAILREDGVVEVQTELVVPGNVDLAIGSIDFVGSLKVIGDVKGDVKIKVQKSIEILGFVEDAVLEAGGDIRVHKGFFGHGKGRLDAVGNVRVQNLMNQTIQAGKDATIDRESVNGTVHAGSRIRSPQAVIAGGWLDAMFEVEVRDLGSSEASQAKVRVGRRGRILERLALLEKDLKHAEKQMSEVKDALYRLIKVKIDAGTLPPDKEQMIVRLQEAQKSLPPILQSLTAERATLTAELDRNHEARVIVHGTVHKETYLEVNGARKVIESALQDAVFVERGGVVEMHAG
jgi:uncharacterized protein (DUF342 family)